VRCPDISGVVEMDNLTVSSSCGSQTALLMSESCVLSIEWVL